MDDYVQTLDDIYFLTTNLPPPLLLLTFKDNFYPMRMGSNFAGFILLKFYLEGPLGLEPPAGARIRRNSTV